MRSITDTEDFPIKRKYTLYNEVPQTQPRTTSTPSSFVRHLNHSIESDLSTTTTLIAPSVSTDVISTNDDVLLSSQKNQTGLRLSTLEEKNTNSISKPKLFTSVPNIKRKKTDRGSFVPFITKYFEYQHQVDTSTATLITGSIALLSVIVGCPTGAYFINRFKWTPMHCARACAIVLTATSLLFLFLMLSCPELKFQQHTPCLQQNQQCCERLYHPVCLVSDSSQMFLSPCHFGCTQESSSPQNKSTYYTQCNCASSTVTLSESACTFKAIPCKIVFILTLFGAAVVVFFTAFIQVPMLRVLLYSVPVVHQTVALGLRQTIVRVLGQTSGPLLFGFVFDESCIVWQRDCYHRRVCKVYNNRQMGMSMALSGFVSRLISSMACVVVFINWQWKHPHDGEENRKSDENKLGIVEMEQNMENTRL
ncbi:unnamed protein product [Didymodactylos carnosus]|nr:unnamed protein product [Didymodactylos carnosus]CAF4017859.1 unnamed protein product [Didymodactylos carnosus]